MLATIINVAAVIFGSLLGLLLGNKIQDKTKDLILTVIGLFILVIGIKMALDGTKILRILLALLAGGLIGQAADLEGKITHFGEFLKRLVSRGGDDGGRFAQGFLMSSVLFCVGAMAIVGSFQAGVSGDYQTILVKSAMDGFMAIILTGSMGIGVAFSALSILIYQGLLTLLSSLAKPFVDANPLFLSEITGVGGILVMMIGINLLGLKKIKTADFMPAIFVIAILVLPETFVPGLVFAF